MNALFADDCGPDQRHGEVDRWYLFLNSSIRLSECGYLTGKPFAGSSWQIDNPATSPSPLPIHSDLRTAKIKHSRSERSRFAEPAHIAAEMIVATHKRTRCVLKRFADGSQPTLLGVLLSTVLAPSAVSSIHMSKIKKSLRSDSLAQATQDRSVRGGNHEPQHSGERFQLTLSRKPPGHTPRPLPVVVSLVVLTPTVVAVLVLPPAPPPPPPPVLLRPPPPPPLTPPPPPPPTAVFSSSPSPRRTRPVSTVVVPARTRPHRVPCPSASPPSSPPPPCAPSPYPPPPPPPCRILIVTPTPSLRPRRHRCRCSPPSPPSPTRLANPSCRYVRRSDVLPPCICGLLLLVPSPL